MANRITSSSEVNRFHQAQGGDAASLAWLMRQHDGLVHYIIRRQWHGSLTYAQVLQEGRIGLWRAILGFDPEQGFAFSSYASVAIARQVWRAVALRQVHPERSRRAQDEARIRKKDEKDGYLVLPPAPPVDPLTHLLDQEVKAALLTMVAQLPPKQRWIVCAYYGLDGQGARTLAQLGCQLGCSKQGVHYHLHRALLYLRHPAFSAALRALVGRNRRRDYLQALQPKRRRS